MSNRFSEENSMNINCPNCYHKFNVQLQLSSSLADPSDLKTKKRKYSEEVHQLPTGNHIHMEESSENDENRNRNENLYNLIALLLRRPLETLCSNEDEPIDPKTTNPTDNKHHTETDEYTEMNSLNTKINPQIEKLLNIYQMGISSACNERVEDNETISQKITTVTDTQETNLDFDVGNVSIPLRPISPCLSQISEPVDYSSLSPSTFNTSKNNNMEQFSVSVAFLD
ncbi:hypothetical protein SNEBB_002350 [Seison nebaliae]|nr:hypothetical protein SNEBB_002350 [Seison nebaliae]